MRFTAVFKEIDRSFPVVFNGAENRFSAVFESIQTATAKAEAEYYEGEYEMTPKTTEQTLHTNGKLLSADVIIKAIPKEYGLVSYDQNRTITVS